ncbi:MAG: anti-virulence regulator CigR family protein [Proteobacteria bacterium]|nr:anti-virulence regulator CigR family protein [Pseudomonadota bacterium]
MAQAKNDKAKGGKKGGASSSAQTSSLVSPGLTAADARQILSAFQLPDTKPLPPGIAKNLARGKPLPPGIAKKNLAPNILKELPYYEGYEWLQVGVDLILVTTGSKTIAKVLEKVFN